MLRPGGRLALSVWGTPEQNRWAGVITDRLLDRGLIEPADPSEPSMFALDDRQRLESLVAGSGFADLELDTVETAWIYGSGEESSGACRRRSAPRRRRVSHDCRTEASPRSAPRSSPRWTRCAADGAVRLPAGCIVLAARRAQKD